jgi:LysM repeat protein
MRQLAVRAKSPLCRGLVTGTLAVSLIVALTGCIPTATHASAHKTPSHRPTATATVTPTPIPPPPPDPAVSHAATPGPTNAAFPLPTITPIPVGTVVASGDVTSPKGSIHYHYTVTTNGYSGYSANFSSFTSTVPVPISVTMLEIPPKVNDGLTYHGLGDHQLGGPTTTPAPASSVDLNSSGPPSYLIALVTYSSATSSAGLPVELGPNKVLAVNTVKWSIPLRETNVHPADTGAITFATGTVTAKTAAGAPKRYLVAPGDLAEAVAKRFSISVEDLIWLNTGLQVFGDEQYLYSGTTLNLDPNSL